MYLNFLFFNLLFKRFYFKDNRIYIVKKLRISSNFRLIKKDRLRIFTRNFVKLEHVSGFKPLIKKFYVKKIDKKRVDLFCVLETWINFAKFGFILFDFIFVYFCNFLRIVNKCYKSKSLLFYKRPFRRQRFVVHHLQFHLKNFFNLVGISRKRKFKLVRNSHKFISVNFKFFWRHKASRIFNKSIKKLIFKLRKKYILNEKT